MQVFISYSRQELTFVDSLAQELAKRNITTWVDFYQLEPGQNWQEQIDNAIEVADVLLLVVSREALASTNVRDEWSLALKNHKRIILLIFQAASLDPAAYPTPSEGLSTENAHTQADWDNLAQSVWVDFRQPFPRAIKQLTALLATPPDDSPTRPQSPPPQNGWRIPPTPLWVTGFSIVLAAGVTLGLLPITLWWIIDGIRAEGNSIVLLASLLGYVLVVFGLQAIIMPWQIARRRYQDWRVLGSLVFIFIWAWILLGGVPDEILGLSVTKLTRWRTLLIAAAWGTMGIGACIFVLLGTRGMYRWAGPRGKMPTMRIPRWLVVLVILFLIYFWAMILADPEIEETPLVRVIILTFSSVLCVVPIITMWTVGRSTRQFRVNSLSLDDIPEPVAPTHIVLDYDPADKPAADYIQHHLERVPHNKIVDLHEADTILMLISRYKTVLDLQQFTGKTIIPVMLPDVLQNAPEPFWRRWVNDRKLMQQPDLLYLMQQDIQKIQQDRLDVLFQRQWIDFRYGLSPQKVNRLAKLIHNPDLLASRLGEFPERMVRTRPPAIRSFISLLWFVPSFAFMTGMLAILVFFAFAHRVPPEIQVYLDHDKPVYLLEIIDNTPLMVGEAVLKGELVALGQARQPEAAANPLADVWCGVLAKETEERDDPFFTLDEGTYIIFIRFKENSSNYQALWLSENNATNWAAFSTDIKQVDCNLRPLRTLKGLTPLLLHLGQTLYVAVATFFVVRRMVVRKQGVRWGLAILMALAVQGILAAKIATSISPTSFHSNGQIWWFIAFFMYLWLLVATVYNRNLYIWIPRRRDHVRTRDV